MGNLLSIVVHAANIHDTKSGILAAQKACEKYPSIQAFCADAGYRGTFIAEVQQQLQRRVDISEKIKPHEWEKLPWRWMRTPQSKITSTGEIEQRFRLN